MEESGSCLLLARPSEVDRPNSMPWQFVPWVDVAERPNASSAGRAASWGTCGTPPACPRSWEAVAGVGHAWRLLSVDPGGFERALDVLERWQSSGTSADRPNAAAGSLGLCWSCAPFARSWEAEAKEGVGW